MASVEFRDVEITYGTSTVVQNFALAIPDGEFVALVGLSGCGKSTILRSVAGLSAVWSGDLQIDSKRMNDADSSERDVAMVFEGYALFPHMTVFGNLAFGLKVRGEPKSDVDRKVNEAADLVGLGAHLHKWPGALSGGQRQRLALARAILRRPGVFLFDEPLSNRDAEYRAAMRAELVRFHWQMGVTMPQPCQRASQSASAPNISKLAAMVA